VKAGAAAQALEDLRWLGLDWDGPVVVQSERWPSYQAALLRLQQQQRIYPCTCSRSDIAAAASAPHADQEGPVYPGTCAQRTVESAIQLQQQGRPFAWRFRVTHTPVFHDLFAGEQRLDLRGLGGDFVVWKNNDTPAYQLAVVVDDAAMGVTEVVRGDDLIPSTPRQLLLYQALGYTPPAFAHVPLVVGPDGRRLAKRHGDTRLVQLRQCGVRPEAVVGLLAWSCGWLERIEPIRLHELLHAFRWQTIPRHPFVLHPAHLRAIGYLA
jgi:glutamyl-tRNA synthetase